MLAIARDRFLLALQYREYRTLWTANVFAGAAAWGLIVARGWLAFDTTGSSLWVGVVTFLAMAPRFFVTPWIGYLADRFDRQTLLSSAYALQLAHAVALAALLTMGLLETWSLVLLSLVNGSLRSSETVSTQSLVPNMLPREHLMNAVALNETTQQGSRLVGPLAIAPLLVLVNLEAAFWLCGAFYGLALIQSFRITTRSQGAVDRSRSVLSNLGSGFAYVYQRPMVLAMVLMAVLHCSLTMSFESMLPVLSDDILGTGAVGVSLLMTGVGAGAIAMTVLLAGVRSDANRGRLFLLLGAVSGLAPVGMALSSTTELSMLAMVAMGASQAGFMTITHTIIQSIIDDGFRGRVSGIYSMHVGGVMAVANLTNAALADFFNAPVVMAASGVLFIAVMSASLGFGQVRRIYFPKPVEAPLVAA
jgi:MFS family permease